MNDQAWLTIHQRYRNHKEMQVEILRKWFKIVVGIVALALWIPGTVLAGTLEDYMEARTLFAASAACQAAYSSRQASLVAADFAKEGWQLEPYRKSNDKADAKFVLAWDKHSQENQDVYLLAVAGTENVRDAKVDMRAAKVPYAGATLEEFAANAERKDLPQDVPRVHEGFNQVAQLLLSVESTQSNDAQTGTPRKLWEILRDDHHDRVLLTGHSLGGAVVEIVAARLLDLGVRPEQIAVINFGAPEVGNEAFVAKYDGKFALTRIVNAGDPVPHAVRRVYGGYRHLGKETVWPLSATVETDTVQKYTPHDMAVYLDSALKKYLPLRRQVLDEGLVPAPEPLPGKMRFYLAPVKNSLPQALQAEYSYMLAGLLEEYDDIAPGFIAGKEGGATSELLKKAAEAGCDLLVMPEIQAVQMQDNVYYVSLNQIVYRVTNGQTLSVGTYGSNTKVMTPLLAFLNGANSMFEDSKAWSR